MADVRFGLKRRPFPATPDDGLYYPATAHETALATLARAINDDEGLCLLSGPPGTGKSLLGHCLPQRLDTGLCCASITNSHFPDRAALLQAILFDLQLPYEETSEQLLRLRLTDAILKNFASGLRTLVIVDEAHLLGPSELEELRLLGNLEAGGKKAFQAVLLAQESILESLKRPELAGFAQRLSVRCSLSALGTHEAHDYLLHHIRLAGGVPERVFDEAALEMLVRASGGIPRVLNQAAHQALTLAESAGLEIIDAEATLEALTLLGLESSTSEEEAEDTEEIGHTFRLAQQTRRTA